MTTLNEQALYYTGLLIVLAFTLFSFVQAGQDQTSDGKAVKSIMGVSGMLFIAAGLYIKFRKT